MLQLTSNYGEDDDSRDRASSADSCRAPLEFAITMAIASERLRFHSWFHPVNRRQSSASMWRQLEMGFIDSQHRSHRTTDAFNALSATTGIRDSMHGLTWVFKFQRFTVHSVFELQQGQNDYFF